MVAWIDWLISPTIVPFQVTTCLGVTVSFLRSLPALPSVTLIPTSWTRRHSLSSPRAGQYSGSPPRRPYSSSLRSILSEGSPYMSSPIHSSLLPSFVPFSSIVTSWSSQTPSKYPFNYRPRAAQLPLSNTTKTFFSTSRFFKRGESTWTREKKTFKRRKPLFLYKERSQVVKLFPDINFQCRKRHLWIFNKSVLG